MRLSLSGATVGALAIALLAGCGGGGDPARAICAPAGRTTLLDAVLRPMVPSAAFTVRAGDDVWMQTTRLPSTYDQSQLFGRTGIEVHLVRDGAQPGTARDTSIVMRRARTWTAVDVDAGSWRAYALRDPAIEIVACGR